MFQLDDLIAQIVAVVLLLIGAAIVAVYLFPELIGW